MSPIPLAGRLAVLAAALAAPVALAQSLPADSLDAASLDADSLHATGDSTAVDSTVADSVQVPPPPPAPVLHAFGDGLHVTLPSGWGGPVAIDDRQTGRAVRSFYNAEEGHPLQNVTLRVERVDGLNALLRERWSRGQTAAGYHGTTPVGPAATPLGGFGVEVAGPGQGGAVVFVHRGASSWTIGVTAPADLWRLRRAEVLAVLSGVALL